MVTAESEGKKITRNSSFFKKLEPDVQVTVREPDDGILATSLPRSHVKQSAEPRHDGPQLISRTIFRNSLALMTDISLFILFSYGSARSVRFSSD